MYCQPLTAISIAIAIATPPPASPSLSLLTCTHTHTHSYEGKTGGRLVEADKKLNLDLEIACVTGTERVGEGGGLKRDKIEFQELCNQIYVSNLIAYVCPVGFELLLPIWITLFKSLGPAIFNTYPTFSGLSCEKSDHSSVMDSEPGRCRRTDGRKWRCSKNVLPLQKYCQRHMHRGRQGSRKHVEPIKGLPRTDHPASDDTRMPIMPLVAANGDSNNPRLSYYRSGFPAILKCRNDEIESRDAALPKGSIDVDYVRSTYSSSKADCLISGGDHADGKSTSMSSGKQNVVGNNYMGFDSLRYGLSPKSVLNAAGKIGLGSSCTTTMEAEQLQRCRRTDGKKWQCRRDALHNQKYCDAHMHRGAKRLVVRPEYSRRFQATPTAITTNLDSGINLNTIPASPSRDGTSHDTSSSTSDATTITDENISFLS